MAPPDGDLYRYIERLCANEELRPDSEVGAKLTRRKFMAEHKLRILRETDVCKALGGIGSILRKKTLSALSSMASSRMPFTMPSPWA